MIKLSPVGFTALLLCGSVLAYTPEAGSDAEMKKGPWAIKPDPGLPNVLILGDSISIGYTLSVRKLLQGKANVFRPCTPGGMKPENCQGTTPGVQEIALEIMKANDIEVNDLYDLMAGRLEELQNTKNVHFNPKGNDVLSGQVAEVIEKALKERK